MNKLDLIGDILVDLTIVNNEVARKGIDLSPKLRQSLRQVNRNAQILARAMAEQTE